MNENSVGELKLNNKAKGKEFKLADSFFLLCLLLISHDIKITTNHLPEEKATST